MASTSEPLTCKKRDSKEVRRLKQLLAFLKKRMAVLKQEAKDAG